MGQTTTTKSTIKCLLRFMSSHGIPTMLVLDNGPQFTASEFAKFCQSNGIEHKKTPPYHPVSNGQVEHIVQELKKVLRKSTYADTGLTVSHFLASYCNTPHSVTQQTPATIICRHVPVTRLQLLQPNFSRSMTCKQSPVTASRSFEPGAEVHSFDHRSSKWSPATILQRLGPLTYSVCQNCKTRHVHFEHLRAFASSRSYTADPPESSHEVHKPAPPPLVYPPADNHFLKNFAVMILFQLNLLPHLRCLTSQERLRLFTDLLVLTVAKLPHDWTCEHSFLIMLLNIDL